MTILIRHPCRWATVNAAVANSSRWRRTFRRIVGEHQAYARAQLELCLGRPIIDVVADPLGLLIISVPSHQLRLADVSPAAQAAAVALSGAPCVLARGGRCGWFWWLTITQFSTDHPRRATAWGTRLVVVETRSSQGAN